MSDFKTEWGVKSKWGLDASKDRETAESVVTNLRAAGHEACVIWRGVTEWHNTAGGVMSADEAANSLPPHLAAKARNHLQVELATILREKDPAPWDEK